MNITLRDRLITQLNKLEEQYRVLRPLLPKFDFQEVEASFHSAEVVLGNFNHKVDDAKLVQFNLDRAKKSLEKAEREHAMHARYRASQARIQRQERARQEEERKGRREMLRHPDFGDDDFIAVLDLIERPVLGVTFGKPRILKAQAGTLSVVSVAPEPTRPEPSRFIGEKPTAKRANLNGPNVLRHITPEMADALRRQRQLAGLEVPKRGAAIHIVNGHKKRAGKKG